MNLSSESPLPTLTLPSPLQGVTDDQWTRFVGVMMTANTTFVGPNNSLGAFEMTPRRLVDLGILRGHLERTRSEKSNRVIWATAEQEDRDRAEAFLKSITQQSKAFTKSCVDYASKIASGEISKPPVMGLSEALAILHRSGPKGLSSRWVFPATQALADKAAGIF